MRLEAFTGRSQRGFFGGDLRHLVEVAGRIKRRKTSAGSQERVLATRPAALSRRDWGRGFVENDRQHLTVDMHGSAAAGPRHSLRGLEQVCRRSGLANCFL